MWFGFVTLFPDMIEAYANLGVFGRGRSAGRIEIACFNPRDYTEDKHRTVDDRPYGGGPGMVMRYEPLTKALMHAKDRAPDHTPVVLLSPQGDQFSHRTLDLPSTVEGLLFVCGRYEGVDERFVEQWVDWQWSVGDFIVSGGELPALLIADAFARQVPGVLGNDLSKNDESYLDDLLEYPHYTRPEIIGDQGVPEELLSGHHAEIEDYRRREALVRTYQRRPRLLTQRLLSDRDRTLLRAGMNPANDSEAED